MSKSWQTERLISEMYFLVCGRYALKASFTVLCLRDLVSEIGLMTMVTAEKIGILGIIVDAKNDEVISFYEGFGFKRLKATETRLVLPITALSKLL